MRRRPVVERAGAAVVAFALTAAMLAFHGLGGRSAPDRSLDLLGLVLAAASALPLALASRMPVVSFLFSAGAGLLLAGLDYPYDFPFGPLAAAYLVALAFSGHPRRSRDLAARLVVGGYVPATALVLLLTNDAFGSAVSGLVFWALLFVGIWVAGDRTRLRRERILDLEARAGRAAHELQRERRLAIAEERTRIARELHDSAGHAVNVILVQAGAARLRADRDRAGTVRSLSIIEDVARRLIEEIDRLVRALREDDPDKQSTPADPARTDELLARHRLAGLDVQADVQGSNSGLPPSLAWATYRILQEALTNAARHGDGTARLRLAYEPRAVSITVTNRAGTVNGHSRPGHGIVGMTERASLLGGTLTAGVEDGDFTVRAWLPHDRSLAR